MSKYQSLAVTSEFANNLIVFCECFDQKAQLLYKALWKGNSAFVVYTSIQEEKYFVMGKRHKIQLRDFIEYNCQRKIKL